MTDPTPDVPTLRRLLAEATPGPWGWEATSDNDNGWCMGIVLDDRGEAIEGRVERGQGEVEDFIAEAPFGGVNGLADAALIAAAVNALPGILDRLEAAEGAVARVEALADEWTRDDADSLNRFGQHLMGGSVLSCAEHLRAALAEVTP